MSKAIIKEIQDDVARLRSERDRIDSLLEHYLAVLADKIGQEDSEDTVSPQGKVMDDAMVAIYEEVGHPMRTKEMYDLLKKRGIFVPGADPIKNVGAHQSLDKERFYNSEPGMWGLAKWKTDKPVSPVGTPSPVPSASGKAANILAQLKDKGIT